MHPNRSNLQIRTIAPDELNAWARGDDSLGGAVRELWDDGSSRPEWCFIGQRDGAAEPVARIGFAAEPVGGGVDTLEFRIFGLELPWDGDYLDIGREVLDATLPRVLPPGHMTVDMRLNAERHDHIDERRRLAEACGFALFQEKHGFLWRDDGRPMPAPERLVFRTLREVGREAYASVMARAAVPGSLDRNDRYYYALCGSDGWASQMLALLRDEDADSWLLAETPDGETVGFAALGAFDDEGTATIVHIGVLPEHRGHGYVDELLRAVNLEARRRGFAAILSDVDVENRPMSAALERAGYSSSARAWHVWHYRLRVREVAS